MSRLREPMAMRQVASALGNGLALVGAQHWLGQMNSPVSWFGLVLVLQFVTQPLGTLVHELGHAVAVACLGRRHATVIVGRGPWVPLSLGPITLRFSPLPTRGVLVRGVCAYRSAGLPWRTIGWIALAGPAATGLAITGTVAVAPLIWSTAPFVRFVVVLTAVSLAASLIVNLLPRPPKASPTGAIVAKRDGWTARLAFARHRSGQPPPVGPPLRSA